jgi:hypothetical protein
MDELLILNLFSSFALCGLIWTIQLVHYPIFNYINAEHFGGAMGFHQQRISYIVIPLMAGELVTSATLVYISDTLFTLHLAGLAAVVLIWLITLLLMVPLHKQLTKGYSPQKVRIVIRANWVRTVLWTLKSLFGIALLFTALR